METKNPLIDDEVTVVCVDDDPIVLNVAVRMLKMLGFNPVSFLDVDSALEFLKNPHNTVDLLLTDVKMPKCSGDRLADHAESYRPGLKTIFMSGFALNTEVDLKIDNREKRFFLGKPFMLDDLAKAIDNALNRH